MDAHSQREWSRFAIEEGGIGTCVVQRDLVDDGSGLLTCSAGDTVVGLCRMSAAPGAEDRGEFLWAYRAGALGFVPFDRLMATHALGNPGVVTVDAAGDEVVAPLHSLYIDEKMRVTRYPSERASASAASPSPVVPQLRTPLAAQFPTDEVATPRPPPGTWGDASRVEAWGGANDALAVLGTPDAGRATTPVGTALGSSPGATTPVALSGAKLDAPFELDDASPGQAISAGQDVPMRAMPRKCQYRPMSIRESMLSRQEAASPNTDEVWGDYVQGRDPTMSIYDAYFRPSMHFAAMEMDEATHTAQLMSPRDARTTPVTESEVSFDVSIESGSSLGERGVDTMLPPVQGADHNRLLNMAWSDAGDTSSMQTSQRDSSSSFTRSSVDVPVAAMEGMRVGGARNAAPLRAVTPQDDDASDVSHSPRGAERYPRLRTSTERSWTSVLTSPPRGAKAAPTSPTKSILGWSPQRRSQRDGNLADDHAETRSMTPSHSSSSLFSSPRSKPSLDLSRSPQKIDAALFQRWTTLLTDRGSSSRTRKKAQQLVEIGVPTALRGRVWLLLADKYVNVQPGVFAQLCQRAREAALNPERFAFAQLIEQDLAHCFPVQKPFRGVDGSTREDIRRILYAYAYHNPDVGYTEGMCLLVGLLLTHIRVEDAFWLLDAIVLHYGLERCYVGKMEQLHEDNVVVDELLRLTDEALYQRLQDLRIEPIMFLPGWILPLFVRTLPWPTLLRFWDLFLSQGYAFVLRTAVAVIQLTRTTLLNTRLCPGRAETLRQLVFVASPPLTPDRVLEHARALPITDKELAKMRRNAAKLVRQSGPTDTPLEGKDAPRPTALQGKPMSRGTIRLLSVRRKARS
ncbi:hypothetical protein MBRA1_002156 [Malassezia brasiliensis]|uniref:Rab-GAP TBC domain-containing protein n=1 Tax=Malassezia brasiliensis TaxID=1821822 RepID=A0AAF0IT18_9BASI|nr:hypothetical protein MBRA1_002156 [Malassezia brasiliensis]